MPSLRSGLVLAASLTLGGCFQSTTLVKINGDGGGTIEQTTLFTAAALAQMRQLASLGGGPSRRFDPISEEQARTAAATLGPGVTYVSSAPIKTDGAEGRAAVYAFDDVSKLHVSQQPAVPGGLTIRTPALNTAEAQAIRFALTRQGDGNATLRIIFPQTASPAVAPAALPDAPDRRPSPDQMATIKRMFEGMKIAVAVEPNGRLVRTSSPYRNGQAVTLLDLDFDQLLKDEALVTRLQGVKTIEDAKAVLREGPGVKVNLDNEVTIEFTPR